MAYKTITTKPQSEDDFELEIEVIDEGTDTDSSSSVNQSQDTDTSVSVKQTTDTDEGQASTIDAPSQKQAQDDKKYTSRAEKRIRELNARAKSYEDKLREYETVIKQLEEKSASSNIQNKETLKTTLESQLKALNSQFTAAMESGDAPSVVNIQDQIMDAKMKLASVAYEIDNQPKKVEGQQPKERQPQPNKVPQKALDWIEDYPDFNTDPVFNGAALAVNNKLIMEGFDPDDDSFYEEINKRLSKRFPDIFDTSTQNSVKSNTKENTSSEGTLKTKEKVEQTVSGASRTPSSSVNGKPQLQSKNKVTLTQEDLKLAERWNMSKEKFAKRKFLLMQKDTNEYSPIFIEEK